LTSDLSTLTRGDRDDVVVRARGVSKRYGIVAALRDLDMDVYRGECICILGPNGAGKTTMVELMEGFRAPDSGTIEVLGVNPAKARSGWRERIGVVSQHHESIPGRTVWETVEYWATLYRASRDPAEVLTTVGLEHKARAKGHSLSGGLRRRLEFALAIIGRPELLFLDEPTAGLDPISRRAFWQLIGQLKDAGTTIVLCTHYLDEAAWLGDRLIVMVAGRMMAAASPDKLGAEHRVDSLVRWSEDGKVHEQRTDDPASLVVKLAQQANRAVEGLEVIPPTLEDAYFRLVGSHQGAESPSDGINLGQEQGGGSNT
jgi:ABC-2 type transport system ATP-binding protein